MSIKNKIIATALSGLAIAGIVAATSLSFPQLTSAQTNTPTAPATANAATPAGRGDRNGLKGDMVGHDKYLAARAGRHRGRSPGRADQGA